MAYPAIEFCWCIVAEAGCAWPPTWCKELASLLIQEMCSVAHRIGSQLALHADIGCKISDASFWAISKISQQMWLPILLLRPGDASANESRRLDRSKVILTDMFISFDVPLTRTPPFYEFLKAYSGRIRRNFAMPNYQLSKKRTRGWWAKTRLSGTTFHTSPTLTILAYLEKCEPANDLTTLIND